MAPWHAILRATPFVPLSPRAQGDSLSPSEPHYPLPAMRNPCAAKSDSALAIRVRAGGVNAGCVGAHGYRQLARMGFGTRDSGTQGSGLRELWLRGEGIEPTPSAPFVAASGGIR